MLELEYYDDRENYTQAKGLIRDIPRNLRLKIDNVTEAVGPVSKVHLTASQPVDLLRFDEWEFMGTSRSKYLHSHVELEGIPTDFWLNGTLEIGGKAFDPLDPDPTVRSVVPQLMDAMMTRLTSKLFTIGKTIRSVPLNILNMPDRAGYTSIELPNAEDYLGKLELWLTSDHYVLVEEGTDFFAFYNDSVTPVGRMVQTGFSARLMDIKSFHAEFADDKLVTLDSRYNRELRALFIDPKNQANASLWFSNIPHNITLHLMDEELMYLGDGTVDRIQYTSEIGEQYMRLVLEGVPGGIRLHQGTDTSGVVALIGEIDSVDIQVTVGRVKRMMGDHLMVVIDPDGATAASAHITGLRSLLYTRTPTNHITLSTGGKPFKVYMSDASREFELRAMLDPLPATLEADVSDVLGMGNISVPTLNDLTSVLDFASIIYAISDLGENIINALGDLSTTLVEGLGTFSSDFDFEFNGNTQMDLVAAVSRKGGAEVEPVPWAHGVTARMVPYAGEVLLDAKVFLTGVAPQGNLSLVANERSTNLTMGLTGFTPRYDTFVLSVDGASSVAGSGGKDIWLFITGLGTQLDLELELDVVADMSIGGSSVGRVVLTTSHDLGPLHLRVRTLEDQYATIELLLSSVPATAEIAFEYSSDISLRSILPRSVEYLFLKISRDLQDGMAPASTVTFHDVPRQMEFFTGSAGTYDMDSPSPVHNLPRVTVDTNEPGLDVLVNLVGRSMGNKADLLLDARDVHGLFMTHAGEEYRITAEKLAFLHMSVRNLVFSDTIWINRIDLAGEDLRRVTVKVPMVFGVYPLFDISDLVASGLQVSLDIDISFGSSTHNAHINMFELPMSLSGLPRSHSNGIALREADEAHRLFVPAPMSTVLGTLLD